MAVVTGGGGGIGGEVSKWLAKEGVAVVVNDVGSDLTGSGFSSTPADRIVSEIIGNGGDAVANYDSVAQPDGAKHIVNAAMGMFGRLDIVCHAAGIVRDRMVFNMLEEEWDDVINVHLYGALNIVAEAVPIMKSQSYGRIILFSSVSALGNLGQCNYSAAKGGQIGIVQGLADELKGDNITINAVFPGADTRMTEGMPNTARAYIGQWGVSAESSDAQGIRSSVRNAPKVAYLCTEAAGNITGQVIGVFGPPMTVYSRRVLMRKLHKSNDWQFDDLDFAIGSSLNLDILESRLGSKHEQR